MDTIAMTYYAAICAALSLLSPAIGGVIPRVLAGVVVGMAAAVGLPTVKAMLGL
ncbi:hypothetical protein [Fluviibacterium sp. S390]|uniref:hypothetical protein n=1 Tax=Fluviibacterium sp. S390 TaxID=3415139 RepID=UPI003C7A753C